MSDAQVKSGLGDAPSPGFLVGQGLLLLATQVMFARLLPSGVDPALASAPWLLLAVAHGWWFKHRLPGSLHYVVVIIGALGASAFEVASGLGEHAHGAAALLPLALDVALYTGFVSAFGVWIGRALRR